MSNNNHNIDEQARINMYESGRVIFPYYSFVVYIDSKDIEPPHFHVEKDDWKLSFKIDDGKLYQIENRGTNQAIFDYIVLNVPLWLSFQSCNRPKETNQENAFATWNELHDEMKTDSILESLENYRKEVSEEKKKEDLNQLETDCLTKVNAYEYIESLTAKDDISERLP